MTEFILILVPFLLLVFGITYLYNEIQAVKDRVEELTKEIKELNKNKG